MRRVRVYTTEAIVLKRQNLGEADRIVTLYTPDEGKLRAVAKGVRRPASRLAGHVELFSLSLVQLARGRELDVLTQADTRAAFRNVREDLTRTSQAYYALELVDRFTPDRLEHRAIFHLLHELLETLDGPVPSPLALHHFTLHALAALGYRPQLAECVLCQAEIAPGNNYFSQPLGGVACPACGPGEPTAQSIPVNVLKTLRYLQRTPSLASVRLAVAPEVLGGVEAVLRAYTEALIERRLRTGEFLDRLRLDARLRAADAAPVPSDSAQPMEPEGAQLTAPGATA
ncbi:MAG TPA: DNA repair protein RecO [Chloroflexota bacterium]|jgi:DNA repair protein RecO (recombination protein O)